MAVNASAYQLAAALGAWLGGRVVNAGPGLRAIYLFAAIHRAYAGEFRRCECAAPYPWCTKHVRTLGTYTPSARPESSRHEVASRRTLDDVGPREGQTCNPAADGGIHVGRLR